MEDLAAQKFAQALSREEKMLILLRDELYEGSWDDMVADLKNRLEGKPYVFKLSSRIEADLERIERLKDFEVIEYAPMPIKSETLQICSSIVRDNLIDRFRDFSLIICHSFPASYLALRIKRKFKIPLILHLHHPPQFLYSMNLAWAKNSFKRMFSYALGRLFNPFLRLFDREI